MKGEPSNSKLSKECRRFAWRKHHKKDILNSVNIVLFWDEKLKREVRRFLKVGNSIKKLKKRTYNRLSKSVVKPQQKHYLSYHKSNPEQAYIQRYSITYNKWLSDQIIRCDLNTM